MYNGRLISGPVLLPVNPPLHVFVLVHNSGLISATVEFPIPPPLLCSV
jgi:hypothetical protein